VYTALPAVATPPTNQRPTNSSFVPTAATVLFLPLLSTLFPPLAGTWFTAHHSLQNGACVVPPARLWHGLLPTRPLLSNSPHLPLSFRSSTHRAGFQAAVLPLALANLHDCAWARACCCTGTCPPCLHCPPNRHAYRNTNPQMLCTFTTGESNCQGGRHIESRQGRPPSLKKCVVQWLAGLSCCCTCCLVTAHRCCQCPCSCSSCCGLTGAAGAATAACCCGKLLPGTRGWC